MFIIDLSFIFYGVFMLYILILIILIGALNHFIITLIFLDMLILLNIFLFISAAILTNNNLGYSFALLLLAIAAVDTTIGLGLFILFFKNTLNVSIIPI